jgi:hypothetical protein
MTHFSLIYLLFRQQQRPPQQLQQLLLPVDISRTWISDLSEPIDDLSVVGSTRQELRKFLLEPPTTRAKVEQSDLTLWNAHVSEATLRQYFEPVAEGSVCQNLSIDISHLLIKPAVIIGENEDGCPN